ncbi:MAG TPA: DUF3574 domain-containing protein [Pyrinomonadaceae bacterium]
MHGFVKKRFLALALLTTSLLAPATYARQQTAPTATQQTSARSRAARLKQVASDPFIRTELFFGTDREEGPDVTEAEFREFLDRVITPSFPDGLTLLTGDGQFCCDANNEIIKEKSFILVLLYPLRQRRESSEKIERIREEYKTAFRQQSVLRVDAPLPVWVSF